MKEVLFGFLLSHLYTHLLPVIALGVVLIVQALGAWMLLRTPWARSSSRWRSAIYAALLLSLPTMMFGFLIRFGRVNQYFSSGFLKGTRAVVLIWAGLTVFGVVMFAISKLIPPPRLGASTSRRRFLLAIRAAAMATPAAVVGYGTFLERTNIELHKETISIHGLHADLDGLRLVQLSDIHLSAFLSEKALAHVVAMANETRAHIALVTGDLISVPGDPLDACLERLSLLNAPAGIFGCLGNHEIYADAEDYATERGAQLGIRFLRGVAEPLRFGAATLNLAGVDYQRMHTKYLVRAKSMIRQDPEGRSLNLLMSHNPDVFPVAAQQGWNLTLAGHTHGGQINFELLRQNLNVARFFTPYTKGLYHQGGSSIYVSSGIGTIGLPIRLGSVPEVALLKLCRI